MKVTVKMKPPGQILSGLGLGERGRVQRFHTQNVARRMVKFMPFRTGVLSTKLVRPGDAIITVLGPYAKYQYYGKVMEGTAPKTVTDRDLVYSTHKHPQAGPFWDRRLMAAEGRVIQQELQDYVNRIRRE